MTHQKPRQTSAALRWLLLALSVSASTLPFENSWASPEQFDDPRSVANIDTPAFNGDAGNKKSTQKDPRTRISSDPRTHRQAQELSNTQQLLVEAQKYFGTAEKFSYYKRFIDMVTGAPEHLENEERFILIPYQRAAAANRSREDNGAASAALQKCRSFLSKINDLNNIYNGTAVTTSPRDTFNQTLYKNDREKLIKADSEYSRTQLDANLEKNDFETELYRVFKGENILPLTFAQQNSDRLNQDFESYIVSLLNLAKEDGGDRATGNDSQNSRESLNSLHGTDVAGLTLKMGQLATFNKLFYDSMLLRSQPLLGQTPKASFLLFTLGRSPNFLRDFHKAAKNGLTLDPNVYFNPERQTIIEWSTPEWLFVLTHLSRALMSPVNPQVWITKEDSTQARDAIATCRGKSAHSWGYAYHHFHQYYEHLLQSIDHASASNLGYRFLILQEGIAALTHAFASETGQRKLHGWNSSTLGLSPNSQMSDEDISKIKSSFESKMTKLVEQIVTEEIEKIDDTEQGLKISTLRHAPTSAEPQSAEFSSINQANRRHNDLGTRQNPLALGLRTKKQERADGWMSPGSRDRDMRQTALSPADPLQEQSSRGAARRRHEALGTRQNPLAERKRSSAKGPVATWRTAPQQAETYAADGDENDTNNQLNYDKYSYDESLAGSRNTNNQPSLNDIYGANDQPEAQYSFDDNDPAANKHRETVAKGRTSKLINFGEGAYTYKK